MGAQAFNLTAHMRVRGIDISVLEYRWSAGEQISELEPDYILRWREYPARVGISARLGEGSRKSFGQLMFFPADVGIETDSADSSERTRHIVARFDARWFKQISVLPGNWDSVNLARCLDMNNVRVQQAIQRLGAEAASPGFASTLLVESVGSLIAIELTRHFADKADSLRVRTRDGELPQSDLRRIFEYIDSFTNTCPSIDDIAALCNISPAHLRRSFKRTTGQTVHRYVETVRLRKAKSLLADTDLPLKEISFRLGFADASTFSSTFRKTSGETPSGYRYRSRL